MIGRLYFRVRGFRDDGEAARARAEALARELAEHDRQFEEVVAHVARKRKLREMTEAWSFLENAGRTERPAAPTQQRRASEERLLRSSSAWADGSVLRFLATASALAFIGSVLLVVLGMPSYTTLVPVALLLGATVTVEVYARSRARRDAREEEAWARSLPYVLTGYPEVLAIPPGRKQDRIAHELDGGEHQILSVEVELASGEVPADLGEIMSDFDPELGTSNPLAQETLWRLRNEAELVEAPNVSNVFYRFSPVTTSNHHSVEDHNRAVRDWVRGFEREVLRPLHARHPLARVTVRLR